MKHILSQNAFWIVNKALAKEVGIDAALLLSDLVTKQEYFDEEWFFNTSENIETDTTLSAYQQRKAIKVLIDKEFIETKIKGIPAKQFFKILHNKLSSFLTTSNEETSQLYNKNTINKNKINNISKRNCEIVINYSFNEFWNLYDKKVGDKTKLEKKWNGLTDDVRTKILFHVQEYKVAQPEKKFRKDPQTYFNNNSWNDEIIKNNNNGTTKNQQTAEYYASGQAPDSAY